MTDEELNREHEIHDAFSILGRLAVEARDREQVRKYVTLLSTSALRLCDEYDRRFSAAEGIPA